MNKIKKMYNKFSAYINGFLAISIASILCMPIYSTDKLAKAAEQAAKGIQGSAQGIVKWLIVISLVVMGLVFLGIGGQRKKEEQKEQIPEKLIGAILIISAIPLAGIIFTWL